MIYIFENAKYSSNNAYYRYGAIVEENIQICGFENNLDNLKLSVTNHYPRFEGRECSSIPEVTKMLANRYYRLVAKVDSIENLKETNPELFV